MKQVSIHPVVTGEGIRVTNEEPVQTDWYETYAYSIIAIQLMIFIVLALELFPR